jgi:hypothetical protein
MDRNMDDKTGENTEKICSKEFREVSQKAKNRKSSDLDNVSLELLKY